MKLISPKHALLYLSIALLLSGVGFSAARAAADAQFSAEMYEKGPQGEPTTKKIFVTRDKMRTEFEQSGQKVVHIVDESANVQWLIYPEKKTYMEHRAPMGSTGDGSNPCAAMAGAECRKLGSETVSGRTTDKWEIVFSYQGQSKRAYQWVDSERNLPLRQEMPDGSKVEFKFIGKETLGGRPVEKWEIHATNANGQEMVSLQWFDPALNLPVKDEVPGQYTREMRNIKEGPQSSELFKVPSDFRQIAAPQQQQRPQGAR